MFVVYILQSESTKRYYIGQTEEIASRLEKHNGNEVPSTKNRGPWKLVYTENFDSRSAACLRELEIKKYKGGIKFKKLLGLWED